MHSLGTAFLGDIDDPLHVQVTLGRVGIADMKRLVRILDMEGIFIGSRIDCHGLNAKLPACAHDPDGNFTAVGDQQFLKIFH